MSNVILQYLVPMITALAVCLNAIGGIFGVVVIPYNPERTEVSLGSNVTSDVDDVLEAYNNAVKKTGFVLGTYSYDFSETDFDTDNVKTNQLLKTYFDSMEATSTAVFAVPGEGKLTKSDVKSAKMSVEDGKRTVIIKVKDYSHGLEDKSNNNPIVNAFGYSTDTSSVFSATGMTINGGELEFNYTDCIISCVIDDNGKIIYGDWDVNCITSVEDFSVSIKDYEVSMGSFDFTMAVNTDI